MRSLRKLEGSFISMNTLYNSVHRKEARSSFSIAIFCLCRSRQNGFQRKPRCRFIPERRRNEARRAHRQLRTVLGSHGGASLGSTAGRAGPETGARNGPEAPRESRVSDPAGLRFAVPPVPPDRRGTRLVSRRRRGG